MDTTGGGADGLRMRPLPTVVIALVLLSHGLLLAAWSAGTPPYQAPDEVAHMIRTYGLSRGQVLAPKATPEPPPSEIADDPLRVAQYEWSLETTTFVQLPPELNPRGLDCARDITLSAACVDRPLALRDPRLPTPTNTGTTTPISVALPALLTGFGGDPGTADAWARVGQILGAMLCLALTLLALRPAGSAAVAGLSLAITPAVLFLGAVVNPTGAEVWLSVTCFALTWRMLQEPGSRLWQVLAAGSVLALPLTRQPGAAWALIGLAAAILLQGRLRGLPGWSLVTWGLAWTLGVGLALTWDARTMVDTPVGLEGAGAAVGVMWQEVDDLLRHAVGQFNVLEYRLPEWTTNLWLWLSAGLLAFSVATRRLRSVAPLAPVLGTLGFLAAFWLLSYRLTGFGLQGRHILGGLVLIPLVAALARPPGPRATAGLVTAATLLQVSIWFFQARRFGAGITSPIRFWPTATWDPAGGWEPWLIVVVTAMTLLMVAAALLVVEARKPHVTT